MKPNSSISILLAFSSAFAALTLSGCNRQERKTATPKTATNSAAKVNTNQKDAKDVKPEAPKPGFEKTPAGSIGFSDNCPSDLDSAPKGGKRVELANAVVDGKEGQYRLLSTSIHYWKKESDSDGMRKANVLITGDREGKITAKLECVSPNRAIDLKKDANVTLESNIANLFSRTDGKFSTRLQIDARIDFSARTSSATLNLKDRVNDAIDEKNQKESRPYGLGDPMTVAKIKSLSGDTVESMHQRIYLMPENELEVRVRTFTRFNDSKELNLVTTRAYRYKFEAKEDNAAK